MSFWWRWAFHARQLSDQHPCNIETVSRAFVCRRFFFYCFHQIKRQKLPQFWSRSTHLVIGSLYFPRNVGWQSDCREKKKMHGNVATVLSGVPGGAVWRRLITWVIHRYPGWLLHNADRHVTPSSVWLPSCRVRASDCATRAFAVESLCITGAVLTSDTWRSVW